MSRCFRFATAAVVLLSFAAPALAQTANSAAPSSSGSGANGVPQFPSGGSAAGGTAAPVDGAKIGAPTAVEQREQQKSDQETKICKGC